MKEFPTKEAGEPTPDERFAKLREVTARIPDLPEDIRRKIGGKEREVLRARGEVKKNLETWAKSLLEYAESDPSFRTELTPYLTGEGWRRSKGGDSSAAATRMAELKPLIMKAVEEGNLQATALLGQMEELRIDTTIRSLKEQIEELEYTGKPIDIAEKKELENRRLHQMALAGQLGDISKNLHDGFGIGPRGSFSSGEYVVQVETWEGTLRPDANSGFFIGEER